MALIVIALFSYIMYLYGKQNEGNRRDNEMKTILAYGYKEHVSQTADWMIRYLRVKEKEFKGSGIQFLKELYAEGGMPQELFLGVKKCLENPNLPYEIDVKS